MPRRQPFQDGSPAPWFPSLSVILLVLAVGLVLVLDYRSAGRGEPAYVFGPTEVVAEAQAPPSVPLVELVKDSLAAAGFDATTIVEDKDETGQPRFRVPTALDRQAPLGRAFEKRLQKSLSRVVKKDKVESAGRVEFAWSVRRHPEESVLVVFDCPVPEPVAKKETKRRPARPGQVALVIDDMGNSLDALEDILSLNKPVTISILPYTPYAKQSAEAAHANGLEVLLHLPLESLNGQDLGEFTEGMITSHMNELEITEALAKELTLIPHIVGVNNHMGSKFTAERQLMMTILPTLRERGLFFLDSLTTARSVAYEEALKLGLPAARRDVFLDADNDPARVRDRLLELFRVAQKNGRAIGICHPFVETLQTLKESFFLVDSYGLEVVPVSRLVRR
ncbi:MAG: divergent polysaccharide deacetylase family protein [Candidatus Aminicenantes bacterium]|nr:divergent polysaccharide deacetylase family protein [Candidatus Aminicenantes bacterium]